jgi:uncharacterized integral membrane protein
MAISELPLNSLTCTSPQAWWTLASRTPSRVAIRHGASMRRCFAAAPMLLMRVSRPIGGDLPGRGVGECLPHGPPGGTVPTAMTDTPTGAGPDPGVPPTEPVGHGALSSHGTGRTRISAAWIGVIAGAVVVALLLVFILQNTRSVKVSFFTANGTLPLGVALLLATIGGLLLAGVVASLRIWQLRHRLTGQRRLARGFPPPLAPTTPTEPEGPQDAR